MPSTFDILDSSSVIGTILEYLRHFTCESGRRDTRVPRPHRAKHTKQCVWAGGTRIGERATRRLAHRPTRTLRGARGMGGRVGQPVKWLLKKRAPPPYRRRSRLRLSGAIGWSTGAGVTTSRTYRHGRRERSHGRTMLGPGRARARSAARRDGGRHDEGVHHAQWPDLRDVGLARRAMGLIVSRSRGHLTPTCRRSSAWAVPPKSSLGVPACSGPVPPCSNASSTAGPSARVRTRLGTPPPARLLGLRLLPRLQAPAPSVSSSPAFRATCPHHARRLHPQRRRTSLRSAQRAPGARPPSVDRARRAIRTLRRSQPSLRGRRPCPADARRALAGFIQELVTALDSATRLRMAKQAKGFRRCRESEGANPPHASTLGAGWCGSWIRIRTPRDPPSR